MGSSFPLGTGEPGFLVSDQSRNLFSFPIIGEVSITLSHPRALQGTFLHLLLCLKMKKEVLALENCSGYYNVSAKNYDRKQLEEKSRPGAILAFSKHDHKNKVPLWACSVITLRLSVNTGENI